MSDENGEQDKAEAIAAGQRGFDTERTVSVVPAPVVNRMLLIGFVIMGSVAVAAIVALATFSIYRGQERHSFNRSLAEVTSELDTARQQRDGFARKLDTATAQQLCPQPALVALAKAQAVAEQVIAEEFGSAIDQVPPAPDAARIKKAGADLRVALDAAQAALDRCGLPVATTTVPGG
jgi:hypothetical protein